MKKIFNLFILSLIIFASVSHIASSQKDPSYLNDSISLSEYLSGVRKGNMSYAALPMSWVCGRCTFSIIAIPGCPAARRTITGMR